MGAFGDKIRRFAARSDRLVHAVHETATDLSFESIVDGSTLTGAPGQPVAPTKEPHAGELRDSWKQTTIDANTTKIATTDNIAREVEDNLRGVHFSNHGPHSRKLTIAAFATRVVPEAVRRAGGGET